MGGSICSTATEKTRERTAWKKRELGCEEMTNAKWQKKTGKYVWRITLNEYTSKGLRGLLW